MMSIYKLLYYNLNGKSAYLGRIKRNSFYDIVIMRYRQKTWNLTVNLRNLLVENYHDNQ